MCGCYCIVTDFIMFGARTVHRKTNFSLLMYLVICSHLLRQLGTLVFGLTQIFPFLAISGIPIRLLLLTQLLPTLD